MTEFASLKAKVGRFNLANKTVLMPDMSHAGNKLVVATLASYGIKAHLLETYKGLQLGKQYTSGKECFPCQITLGDLLHLSRPSM